MNSKLRIILRIFGVALLGVSAIRLCFVNARSGHFSLFKGGFVGDIIIDRMTGAMLVATEKGVFVREKKEQRWRPTSMTKDTRVIVQHVSLPKVFFAGTEEDGIWRSTDGGRTWAAFNAGLAHKTVYAIATGPGPGVS